MNTNTSYLLKRLTICSLTFFAACSSPTANNQTAVEQPTPTPTPAVISIQELMGTGSLEISAKFEAGRLTVGGQVDDGGPCESFATGSVKAGWVFINGQLQGRLPLHKAIQLKPDSYSVSFLLWCKGPDAIWFDNWQTNVTVGEGKTVVAKLSEEPVPIEPAYRLPVYEIYTPIISSSRYAWRDDLTRWDSEVRQGWNDFLATPEWKTLYAAAASPPLRRRVRLDLPTSLGGPREVDAEQINALAEWFDLKLQRVLKVSDGPIPDFQYEDGSASDDEIRVAKEGVKSIEAFQKEKIAVVKKILEDFAEALRNAPEE